MRASFKHALKPTSPDQRTGRVPRALSVPLVCLVVAAAVPFWLGFSYTFNHFYDRGGTLFDASIFVHLLGWSFPTLEFPPALGGGTYWGTHVRPFFLLIHPIQQASGLSPVMFLCVMQGAPLALLAAVFFLACRRGFHPATVLQHGGIALAAILFALCGAITQTLRDAHPEILIPAGIMLSSYLIATGRHRLGAAVLVPFLLVREDSGIYAGFLFLAMAVLAVDRRAEPHLWRWLVGLGIGALIYSAIAFASKAFFPGHDVAAKILGSPAFAHVDAAFLLERLSGFLAHGKPYWLAAVLMGICAFATRSWIPLIAALALAPTTMLTAMAYRDHVASFALQYGYPLALMIGWWPLALIMMQKRSPSTRLAGRPAAVVLALVLVTGHFNSGLERYVVRNPWPYEDFETARRLETVAAEIGAHAARRDDVFVENGVVALRPDLFAKSRLLREGPQEHARLIFCFESRFDEHCLPTARLAGLSMVHRLGDTQLLAVTRGRDPWLEEQGFVATDRRVERPRGLVSPAARRDSEAGERGSAMRRYHDMGGAPAGPVETDEHDPAPWEKRVDAILKLLSDETRRVITVDELRRGIEDLGPGAYDEMSYYERWIASIGENLLEKGVITVDELGRRMAEIERRWQAAGHEPAARS